MGKKFVLLDFTPLEFSNCMDPISSNTLGSLTVITGPSGVGKGTVVKELLATHKEIWLSVSATTRSPRDSEIEGQHYFFLEKENFVELSKNGGFLEWAEFAGNFYGTPFQAVKEKISERRSVLLEIELLGARQVKKSFPEAFMIFLAPPSFEELESRIRTRASDSEQAIEKRLSRARVELKAQDEFDAVVVNDELNQAVKDISNLMNKNN